MSLLSLQQPAHSSHAARALHSLTSHRYLTAHLSPRRLVRLPVRGTQTGPSVSDPRRPRTAPPQPRPDTLSTPAPESFLDMCPSRTCVPVRCPHLAWLLSLVLFAGLSACGNPSPGAPGSGLATGSADAPRAGLAVNIPADPAPLPAASAPDGRITAASRAGNPAPDGRVKTAASPADPPQSDGRANSDQAQREARQQWLAELGAHPDATVRLQALELWAQQPGDALDPEFYAFLDDEDESVRARAEALWEQQLTEEQLGDQAG